MCYSRKPKCTKHGDSVTVNWVDNIYIAKCGEPGCSGELIMEQQITKDQNGHVHVDDKIIKNTL
jgi:hypothetical protein